MFLQELWSCLELGFRVMSQVSFSEESTKTIAEGRPFWQPLNTLGMVYLWSFICELYWIGSI